MEYTRSTCVRVYTHRNGHVRVGLVGLYYSYLRVNKFTHAYKRTNNSVIIVFFSRYPNLLDLLLEKLEECATILEKPLVRTDIRSSMKAAQSVPFLYPIAILFTHLLPSSLEFIPLELSSKVTRFAPLLIRYFKIVVLLLRTYSYRYSTCTRTAVHEQSPAIYAY